MSPRHSTLVSLLMAITACPSATQDSEGSPTSATGEQTTTATTAPTTGTAITTDADPTTGTTTAAPTTGEPTTAPGTATTDDPDPGTTTGTTGDPVACDLPESPPSAGPSNTGVWRLEQLDLGAHPQAVCNDGTAAVYLIRRNPGATKWLYFLEGGGNCSDGPTCKQRWNSVKGLDLMSSISEVERYVNGTLGFPDEGVFAADKAENPALHDANFVMIPYCSSDLWSGDREGDTNLPTSDVGRWHFRGRAIAHAVLAELLTAEGMDAATDVVLGGGSAGGAGMFINVDELAAELPPAARVLGMPDAGYQIVYPAFDPKTGLESTETPTPVEKIALAGFINWGGRGDESCDAAATDDAERILCRSAELLTSQGHITTPLLLINTQYDYNQTTRLGITVTDDFKVADPDENAFTVNFAASMRERLAATDAMHSIFSDYSSLHVTAKSVLAATVEIDGVTLRDAIAAWHQSPCKVSRRIEQPIAGLP